MCISKGSNAIAGSDIIFPSQADSKHTEGFAGKEEKQEESVISIFKVNKVLEPSIMLLISCHLMQLEKVEIVCKNNGIWWQTSWRAGSNGEAGLTGGAEGHPG